MGFASLHTSIYAVYVPPMKIWQRNERESRRREKKAHKNPYNWNLTGYERAIRKKRHYVMVFLSEMKKKKEYALSSHICGLSDVSF